MPRRTHGMVGTRIYGIWKAMKSRCYCKSGGSFENYGARGISVCEEWRNDFRSFQMWALMNGYRDNLTIDRIDNDGNYEPSNCRWITQAAQLRNTRRNPLINYRGRTMTVTELAKEHGLSQPTLWRRLYRFKWDLDRALVTVPRRSKSCPVELKELSA